jgi:hypothetical protein
MDVIFRLRRRLFHRGIPPLTAAGGLLLLLWLPLRLRLTSTTCFYDFPCSLPLRPASTACLYGLPLPPASTPTVCLYGLPSSCHRHHHHLHRPFPVQAEHLLFSFICDLCFFPSSFLEIIFLFFF